jgi:hypothetical protein
MLTSFFYAPLPALRLVSSSRLGIAQASLAMPSLRSVGFGAFFVCLNRRRMYYGSIGGRKNHLKIYIK